MTDEKITQLLELTEHPENFSNEEKKALLDDKEAKEYYNSLVDMRQAMTKHSDIKVPDVNAEWNALQSKKHTISSKRYISAAAVILFISCITFATIHISHRQQNAKPATVALTQKKAVKRHYKKRTAEFAPTEPTKTAPIVFDDVELQTIMSYIAKKFDVKDEYQTEELRHIRLYLQWEEGQTVDDICDKINHFEKVHVSHQGNILTIE